MVPSISLEVRVIGDLGVDCNCFKLNPVRSEIKPKDSGVDLDEETPNHSY